MEEQPSREGPLGHFSKTKGAPIGARGPSKFWRSRRGLLFFCGYFVRVVGFQGPWRGPLLVFEGPPVDFEGGLFIFEEWFWFLRGPVGFEGGPFHFWGAPVDFWAPRPLLILRGSLIFEETLFIFEGSPLLFWGPPVDYTGSFFFFRVRSVFSRILFFEGPVDF